MTAEPTPPLTRRGLLLDQYETSYTMLAERLPGLGDDEYFWEPAASCWSLRRQSEVRTARSFGAGEWRLEFERPEPAPAPVTTVAWRLCHLVSGQLLRYDWTFGRKELTMDALAFPGSAAEALAWMEQSHRAWQTGLKGLAEADLDVVGLSSYPQGLDPQLPFGAILWWTNRELIHHGAELGLLRDLWAARYQRS
jgi:hypothetical protein